MHQDPLSSSWARTKIISHKYLLRHHLRTDTKSETGRASISSRKHDNWLIRGARLWNMGLACEARALKLHTFAFPLKLPLREQNRDTTCWDGHTSLEMRLVSSAQSFLHIIASHPRSSDHDQCKHELNYAYSTWKRRKAIDFTIHKIVFTCCIHCVWRERNWRTVRESCLSISIILE